MIAKDEKPPAFAADFACELQDGARVTAVQALAHEKPIVVLKRGAVSTNFARGRLVRSESWPTTRVGKS